MSVTRCYKIGNWLYKHRIPFLPGIVQRYINVVYSCDISIQTNIGNGSIFKHHGVGVIVHPMTIIGERVMIYQNVTLGGRNRRGTPIIEDDVFIGPGACILGGVTIGKGSVIGSNAIVLEDVPPNSLVVAPKAEIKVKYYGDEICYEKHH